MNNIICPHPALDIIPHYLSYISICFLPSFYYITRPSETKLFCPAFLPVRFFQKQNLCRLSLENSSKKCGRKILPHPLIKTSANQMN